MKFNKQQEEIINTIDGNLCVIAAAGSGKTTVLVHRIKNMVQNYDIAPNSILAVSFNRKAKENIVNRLEKLGIRGVNIETFHSLALKIIRAEYGDEYTVWTAYWEKQKALEDICSNLNICDKAEVPVNELLRFIALQKTYMLKPTDQLKYPKNSSIVPQNLQRIYKAYEEEKAKKSLIEFDDFLNIANEILDNNCDTAEFYRNAFDYVLADEFQDVSLTQSLFLKKLNTENTMIVGDPLQAIYAFRGGNSSFILNFNKEYANTKVVNLNTNYRCSQNIVDLANKFSHSIPDAKNELCVDSIAFHEKYTIPEYREFSSSSSEASWISKKIKMLLHKGYANEDIAILARTNAQLQQFETVFHDENIPFEIVNGMLFTQLPEIKLMLCYFRLAMNENDNIAFEYLYNKPNRWLGKKFMEEVKENSFQKNESLLESMDTIARRNWKFKRGIDEIYEVINRIQSGKYDTVKDLVQYLRKRLNLDAYFQKDQSDDSLGLEKIENMNTFETMCEEYETVEKLLKYINELNKAVENINSESVKLLTIHKAKGLEYPVVFVVGCNDGLLPHSKNEDVQDEQKLFYVAVTRAEKELFLSSNSFYNNMLYMPSPFIKQIKTNIRKVDSIVLENAF